MISKKNIFESAVGSSIGNAFTDFLKHQAPEAGGSVSDDSRFLEILVRLPDSDRRKIEEFLNQLRPYQQKQFRRNVVALSLPQDYLQQLAARLQSILDKRSMRDFIKTLVSTGVIRDDPSPKEAEYWQIMPDFLVSGKTWAIMIGALVLVFVIAGLIEPPPPY